MTVTQAPAGCVASGGFLTGHTLYLNGGAFMA